MKLDNFINEEYLRIVKYLGKNFPSQDMAGVMLDGSKEFISFSLN